MSGVADQVRVADHTQAIGSQGRPQDDIGDDDGLAGVQGDRRKHRGTQKDGGEGKGDAFDFHGQSRSKSVRPRGAKSILTAIATPWVAANHSGSDLGPSKLCVAGQGRFFQNSRRLRTPQHVPPGETMAKSNLSDGAADGLAAVIIVSVVVTWVVVWLGGMPA